MFSPSPVNMTNEQKEQTTTLRSKLKTLSLRPEQKNGHKKDVDPEFEEAIKNLRAEIKRKASGI